MPDFRDRYRASPDESPADRLCGLWEVGTEHLLPLPRQGPATRRRRAVRPAARRPTALLVAVPGGDRRCLRTDWAGPTSRARGLARAAGRRSAHGAAMAAPRCGTALQARRLRPASSRRCSVSAIELAADPDTDAAVAAVPAAAFDARTYARLLLANAGAGARARRRRAAERRGLRARAATGRRRRRQADAGHRLRRAGQVPRGARHRPRVRLLPGKRRLPATRPTPRSPLPAEAYLVTLVQLAWLYMLRNDPRARTVLDRAEALRAAGTAQDGRARPCWNRPGASTGAAAATCRARSSTSTARCRSTNALGDRQAVLKTYGNLALIYGDARLRARDRLLAARAGDGADASRSSPRRWPRRTSTWARPLLAGQARRRHRALRTAPQTARARAAAGGGRPRALQPGRGLLQALPDLRPAPRTNATATPTPPPRWPPGPTTATGRRRRPRATSRARSWASATASSSTGCCPANLPRISTR